MKRGVVLVVVVSVMLFFVWRFIRPLNIFVITDAFERPVSTAKVPAILKTLRASECGACHGDFYKEWRTTIHSRAWVDPYFQADWKFDRSQQVCRNCHTPLDRQQPSRVLGFRDKDKWDPILKPNPDYDPKLQHEGVTCAACHLRGGKIVGVIGVKDAPHPVKKLEDANQVCVRCHVVEGDRWDTFFRFPPCGTVAEINRSKGLKGGSGEAHVKDIASLGCVNCHMPAVKRPLVKGGPVREARRHLWRGGHEPAMVKKALTASLKEESGTDTQNHSFVLVLTNTGAAHYLPTGTPDRHLTVRFRLYDRKGYLVKEKQHVLIRKVLWRPFIIDLWDTRLRPGRPRSYRFSFTRHKNNPPSFLDVEIRYHLLAESRRKRIGYRNKSPISYAVWHRRVNLN